MNPRGEGISCRLRWTVNLADLEAAACCATAQLHAEVGPRGRGPGSSPRVGGGNCPQETVDQRREPLSRGLGEEAECGPNETLEKTTGPNTFKRRSPPSQSPPTWPCRGPHTHRVHRIRPGDKQSQTWITHRRVMSDGKLAAPEARRTAGRQRVREGHRFGSPSQLPGTCTRVPASRPTLLGYALIHAARDVSLQPEGL